MYNLKILRSFASPIDFPFLFQLIDYKCVGSPFSSVLGSTGNECDEVTSTAEYTPTALQVQFTIGPSERCKNEGTYFRPILVKDSLSYPTSLF